MVRLNSLLQAPKTIKEEEEAKFRLKSSTLYSQCQRNKTQTGQELDPHILHVLDDKVSCRLAVNHWDSHALASGKWNHSFKSNLALHFHTAVHTLLLFLLLVLSSAGFCEFNWISQAVCQTGRNLPTFFSWIIIITNTLFSFLYCLVMYYYYAECLGLRFHHILCLFSPI